MAEAKTVVVTGGASGIGAGCTRYFGERGWNVVICHYGAGEADAAAALAAEIEGRGQRSLSVDVDVTSDADCRRAAALVAMHFGRLDALVHCAGITRVVPHADLDGLTLEDFQKTASVNTGGVFQMVRACTPLLQADGGGAVVIVSSYGAMLGTGSSIAYAASKGATNTLTMSLARVLAPAVRVNAVCPALVSGGLVERLDPDAFTARAALQIDRAPLHRVADPREVAAHIHWLAEGATLMTGSILSLDCGLHLLGDA